MKLLLQQSFHDNKANAPWGRSENEIPNLDAAALGWFVGHCDAMFALGKKLATETKKGDDDRYSVTWRLLVTADDGSVAKDTGAVTVGPLCYADIHRLQKEQLEIGRALTDIAGKRAKEKQQKHGK